MSIWNRHRSIETRFKEHERQIRLCQLEKPAVAEHSTELGHRIKFHEVPVLASRLRGKTCQGNSGHKIAFGKYEHRGRIHTQQSVESQQQIIKALQQITKIQRLQTQRRTCEKLDNIIGNKDTRLSDKVIY
jgi:hypothetical protein